MPMLPPSPALNIYSAGLSFACITAHVKANCDIVINQLTIAAAAIFSSRMILLLSPSRKTQDRDATNTNKIIDSISASLLLVYKVKHRIYVPLASHSCITLTRTGPTSDFTLITKVKSCFRHATFPVVNLKRSNNTPTKR